MTDSPEERNSTTSPYSRSDEFSDKRLTGESSAPTLKNATYIDADRKFNGKESRNGMGKWERLELYNRGTHNGKWTIDQTQKHDQDDWYFCDALTAQMGLSDREQLLTWRVFKTLDMRTYRGIEPEDPEITMKQYLVAFCVGAHIYNKLVQGYGWTDDDWKYYPGTDCPPKMKRYRGLKAKHRKGGRGDAYDRKQSIERCADKLGFDDSEIRSCFEMVRTHLPAWVHED